MLTKILKWIAELWLLATLIIISAGLLSRPQQADLAIVYGNKVHVDGSPSSRLAARLDEARLCYEKGLCRAIMVSGGIDKHGTDEALAMKRDLVNQGVPENRIVMDNMGRDTWCRWRWGSAQIWRRQVDGGVANAYARDEMTGRWSWGYWSKWKGVDAGCVEGSP